jgi:hypothetical protein
VSTEVLEKERRSHERSSELFLYQVQPPRMRLHGGIDRRMQVRPLMRLRDALHVQRLRVLQSNEIATA